MPHGGFKQSGYGKDMSLYSMEEYTRIKHVAVKLVARLTVPLLLSQGQPCCAGLPLRATPFPGDVTRDFAR